MKRISSANIKRKKHPLTNKARLDYLRKKNENLDLLINTFNLKYGTT